VIRAQFPAIDAACRARGIDITRDLIPVVPAAHYTCGGVVTDLHGRTDILGLYVVGESACTGLHGANRMASNSLLECIVFAHSAAADILHHIKQMDEVPTVIEKKLPWGSELLSSEVALAGIAMLQKLAGETLGIVRTNDELNHAVKLFTEAAASNIPMIESSQPNVNSLEWRNLLTLAKWVAISARNREGSIGLHYNQDQAQLPQEFYHSMVKPATQQEEAGLLKVPYLQE
jgi:L-aspartate oxidase